MGRGPRRAQLPPELVFPVIWLQARKDSNVRLQNRRVVGATLLAFAAALVLAGCGAGQITQTATQEPAINGANAQVGTLYIRDAALQFPPSGPAYKAGSSAALTLTIINAGQQDDELVGVTTDAASGAVIQGSKLVVAGSSLVISPPAAAPGHRVRHIVAELPRSGDHLVLPGGFPLPADVRVADVAVSDLVVTGH